jgi:hypothetical protein
MPAARPAVGDAEHALDAANRATDAGADRAADWPSRPAAFARTLIRATLHAAEHALRMRRMRNGNEGQRDCRRRGGQL